MRRRGRGDGWLVLALLLSLPGLNAASCADSLSMRDGYGPLDGEVIDSVVVEVVRTAPTRITSADGQVTVEIPPLAIEETTTFTLSRVRLEGSDIITTGYRLEPEGRVFLQPVRIAFGAGALPTPRTPGVRVVQLSGHGSTAWQALSRPEATSAEVLGRTRDGGTFAAVDTDLVVVGSVQPFTETSEADVLLSRGSVEAARAAYAAVLNQSPQSARARLGHATTALLLLPDAAPVRNVLSRCGVVPIEPDLLYGTDGYLQQRAADQAGEAAFTLDFGGLPSPSLAEAVVARISGEHVTMRIEDRDHIDGPWVLEIDIDLSRAGEDFARGQDLEARSFPGTITLQGPVVRYQANAGSLGTLHIDAAGRAPGQELALTIRGLSMISSGGNQVRIDGEAADVVARLPVPAHALFDTSASAGPPYRDPFVVLLDGCGASVTTSYLFSQVELLVTELGAVADDLQVVLSEALAYDPGAPDAGEDPQRALSQALPSFLLRAPADVPLNLRDVRLLITGLRSLDKIVGLLAPYRFLGYDAAGTPVELTAFLADQELAYATPDGSIGQRSERALSAALIAADLSRNLLASALDRSALQVELAPLRLSVGQLVDEAVDALLQSPATPGLFDLDSAHVVAFTSGLANALQAVRASLGEGSVPVAAPANPGYAYLATGLFDTPPLHADLVAAVGSGDLFAVEPGDPEAADASARNPSLAPAPGLIDALLETVLTLPPDPGSVSCHSDASCGVEGVVCDLAAATCEVSGDACHSGDDCEAGERCLGVCARAGFAPVPPADVERALGGDPPAIIHSTVWRAFAPLLEALPRP